MESQNDGTRVAILLVAVSGFCDAVTFVAGGGIFSAHIIGNCILFAAQLIRNRDVAACIKLAPFPVFLIGVFLGEQLLKNKREKEQLVRKEASFLLAAGLVALVLPAGSALTIVPVLFTVMAMGLQTAFSKSLPRNRAGHTIAGLWRQLALIGGFIGGAALGALAGSTVGLTSVLLPGVCMVLFSVFSTDGKRTAG
jgi:uncharacterized membrane protein YoaK (UPF0700 family)